MERVTSYARSKTIVKKKTEELSQLHQAGLSRLHIGLETGDDELLSYINKGVTAEEHIMAGRKALEAGFELSEYVMPGLGGKADGFSMPKAQLFEAYQKGEFELTSPHQRLREIELMIENLQVTSRVCFDHNLNPSYWSGNSLIPLLKQDYNGYKFPEEKEVVLQLINKGLQLDEAAFIDTKDMVSLPHL